MNRFLIASVVLALLFAACKPPPDSDVERKQQVDAMYQDYAVEFPDVATISASELRAELDAGKQWVVVDARAPEERAVSIIPFALTVEEYADEREALSGRPVAVYCTIGYRSGVCARDLARQGVKAYNVEGGILAWLHQGGTLVDREGRPTKRVHVYGPKWDLAPNDSESVY